MLLSKEMYPYQKIIPLYCDYIKELNSFEESVVLINNQKAFECLQNISSRNNWHLHPIVSNKEVIGFVIITEGEDLQLPVDYCIEEFYVIPEYRRQGIGRIVFDEILDKYGQKGSLYILDKNIPAQKFWDKMFIEYNVIVESWTSDIEDAKLYSFQ